METPVLPDNAGKKWLEKRYTCEGLTYTLPQLLWTSFLILLGFFCYTLALAFVPSIMPLKLDALGANSKTIAFIASSLKFVGKVRFRQVSKLVIHSYFCNVYRSKTKGFSDSQIYLTI